MSDPSLPMQAAIVAALRAHAGVQALVAARVYDAVPAAAVKPYVNVADWQVIPDKADCVDGTETSVTVHGWADGPKGVVIKQLGAAIKDALDDVPLTVSGHRVPVFEFAQIQYLDDPDGTTKHVAVTFRALTEPA